MQLVLGVLDVAYSNGDEKGVKTTSQVAQTLEDKYHVMETFFEMRKQKIGAVLSNSVANSIENMVKFGKTQ
ncbi:MAG TPA: hypothetical protein VMV54_02390, partial [Acidocella sp.]|nr:hypothetical protein [Acidocella sp.]